MISSSKYVNKNNIYSVKDYADIPDWLIKNKDGRKKVVICCSDCAAEAVISASDILSKSYQATRTVSTVAFNLQQARHGAIQIRDQTTGEESHWYEINVFLKGNVIGLIRWKKTAY